MSNIKENEVLYNDLTSLEDEIDKDYRINLKIILKKYEIQTLKKYLYELLKNIDNDSGNHIYYNAFYLLTMYCRKYNKLTEYGELIKKYKGYFINKKTFNSIECIYYTRKGTYYKDKNFFMEALKLAEKCNQDIKNDDGILHLYSETVAAAFLQEIEFDEDTYNKALKNVNEAIKLKKSYAKYYYTKAILLVMKKEYYESEANINYAIEVEDSTTDDGIIKLIEYKRTLISIDNFKLKDEMCKIKEDITIYKKEVQNLNIKSIELLSFFTSIITFIITFIIQAINSNEFIDMCSSMIVMAGAIIIINMCLKLQINIYTKEDNEMKNKILIFIGVGVLLVLGGIALYLFFPIIKDLIY